VQNQHLAIPELGSVLHFVVGSGVERAKLELVDQARPWSRDFGARLGSRFRLPYIFGKGTQAQLNWLRLCRHAN
jgi:hypothetical protein